MFSKEIIVAFLLLVICVIVLNFTCQRGISQMNKQGGLKAVVNELWEGAPKEIGSAPDSIQQTNSAIGKADSTN